MLTNFLINVGITRDWAGWFWGRLVSGATILMGLYVLNGDQTFAGFLTQKEVKLLVGIAVIVLWLAGKYDSSELPSGGGKSTTPPAKVIALFLPILLAAGMVTTSCASAQAVHVATAADTAIVNALHQVYVDEGQAYSQHLYAQAKHDAYLKAIKQADQDALALTDAIDAWRQAGGDPKTVPAIVSRTKGALQQVLDDLNSLPASSPLIQALQAAIKLLG